MNSADMNSHTAAVVSRRRARAAQAYHRAAPGTGHALARRVANLQSVLIASIDGLDFILLPEGSNPITL